MKVVTVDFDQLISSMKDLARLHDDFYFDRMTGNVFGLPRSCIKALSRPRDVKKDDLPDWDRRMMPVVRDIVLEGSTRYLRIPEAFGLPEHKWMAEFARGLESPKLQQQLLLALRGRGGCTRFTDILSNHHPIQWTRWRRYEVEQWKIKIQLWLENTGILGVPKKSSRRPSKE